ncbi:30S ribosomal protein S21 [Sungkyunkwania multivorans]|uniref:Small ribosomal subunit protein bS21 n=1 Tax=Sungkyunkwania multivorans TaxID=1173618 RepID=A0ABW3CYR5_9FLAO
MLIIKILPGENIERALKKYRNKVRKTQQLKRIKENREFIKKSREKREGLEKAIYRNEYFRKNEE